MSVHERLDYTDTMTHVITSHDICDTVQKPQQVTACNQEIARVILNFAYPSASVIFIIILLPVIISLQKLPRIVPRAHYIGVCPV